MKRTLSIVLVLLMALALFAGCSGGDDAADGGGTAPSAAPSASPDASPAGEDAGGDDSPSGNTDSLVSLPLVDETAEFEIWAMNSVTSYGVQDLNDTEAFTELENRTNVHINWILPPSSDIFTSFSLYLAGGDLPDSFMFYSDMLPGGFDAALQDEYITDVSDIVAQYCPNYYAQISSDEETWRGAHTDTGVLPGFFCIKRTVQPNYAGPMVRKDMLDNLGIEIPTTLDGYHDMLATFRDSGVEIPTTITFTGLASEFMSAYELAADNWYQIDGTVHYSAVEDAFLDYLTMMHRWYSEGLIYPEFYVDSGYGTSKATDTAYTLTGRIAVFTGSYQAIHSNMVTAAAGGDSEYELVAIPIPMKNEGDIRHIGDTSQERWQGTIGTISPTCEDQVTLARWYDYLFSEEGSVLGSYGTGTAYFIDESGHPRGNELITENPDGYTPYQAMNIYGMAPEVPYLYDWERELLVTMNDNAIEAIDIWSLNDDNAYAIPSRILPTVDESTRFSAIMGDVDTYLDEIVVKFITGDEPLENFENFRQNLYNLGLDEAIQIKQAGYERYLAR